jgi:hypothetical protein
MSMTIILLTASIVCNVWFLILLLHDRIMDTRVVRFLKGIAGLWKSLQPVEKEAPVKAEWQPAGTTDVIGKSRFKMPPTRTTTAIPTPQAATSEKGEEVSSDDVTFDDENGKTQPSEPPHPVQVPDEKLDETFTSIPPEELEFGEDEPEEESPERPQASGSSFDEIDDAVKTAKNPEATETEQTRAAKVFSDMEGTELYEKLMAGSTEMSIRIKGLIEIRLKKPKKEFVIPDNIEEFDIRKYV